MDELREKVLKGLGCCIQQGVEDVYCRELDCPYKSDSDSCRLNCWIQLLMDAVSLLEAQEPKFVPDIAEAIIGCKPKVKVGHCPSCDVLIYETDKFCRKCGQAVKWE